MTRYRTIVADPPWKVHRGVAKGDPKAEPTSGVAFKAMFTVRVGYSNGDFRYVILEDAQGRPWATASVPFQALRGIRGEGRADPDA